MDYILGNHELWLRKTECKDSIEKFEAVMDAVQDLGVHTAPKKVHLLMSEIVRAYQVYIADDKGNSAVWIVPLLSWYDRTLSVDIPTLDSSLEGWMDEYLCKWPPQFKTVTSCSSSISQYFVNLNRSYIRRYDSPVISFSHFYSRPEQLL